MSRVILEFALHEIENPDGRMLVLTISNVPSAEAAEELSKWLYKIFELHCDELVPSGRATH